MRSLLPSLSPSLLLTLLSMQDCCRGRSRTRIVLQQSAREQPPLPLRTGSVPRALQEAAGDRHADELDLWRRALAAVIRFVLPPSSSLFLDEYSDLAPPSVNLPELLAHTALDPGSMSVLKENMVQFLQCVLFCTPPLLSLRTDYLLLSKMDGPEPKGALRPRVHRYQLGLPEQQPRLILFPSFRSPRPLLSSLNAV